MISKRIIFLKRTWGHSFSHSEMVLLISIKYEKFHLLLIIYFRLFARS